MLVGLLQPLVKAIPWKKFCADAPPTLSTSSAAAAQTPTSVCFTAKPRICSPPSSLPGPRPRAFPEPDRRRRTPPGWTSASRTSLGHGRRGVQTTLRAIAGALLLLQQHRPARVAAERRGEA